MLSGNGCDRTDADKMSTDAKLMQTNFFKLMLDIFLDVFSRKMMSNKNTNRCSLDGRLHRCLECKAFDVQSSDVHAEKENDEDIDIDIVPYRYPEMYLYTMGEHDVILHDIAPP